MLGCRFRCPSMQGHILVVKSDVDDVDRWELPLLVSKSSPRYQLKPLNLNRFEGSAFLANLFSPLFLSRCRSTGDPAGRKRGLQVIAASVCIHVQHLPGEIKSLHQP